MWSYYGSKSKVVHLYPRPVHDKIIEPFAGSARYALRWWERDVLLVDKYPVIVDLWLWLQQASEADILGLPDIHKGQSVDGFDLPTAAKHLIGFCINGGSAQPKKTAQGFANWNDVKRDVSKSLHKIRHWKIELSDYSEIRNEQATWFIDPPYQFGGEWYVYGSQKINFRALSEWCQSRNGQAIVCENTKADWLPFFNLRQMTGAYSTTTEAIWSNLPTDFDVRQGELFPGGL